METKVVEQKSEVRASINDVADWFLLQESMSNKKIQKLCYYAQAFSLVLLKEPIATDAEFQAWVHGPVSKILWDRFKGYAWNDFKLTDEGREKVEERTKSVFNGKQIELLESVWDTYGEYAADQLETLTHKERPWQEQREGLGSFENSQRKISEDTMRKYYGELLENAGAL